MKATIDLKYNYLEFLEATAADYKYYVLLDGNLSNGPIKVTFSEDGTMRLGEFRIGTGTYMGTEPNALVTWYSSLTAVPVKCELKYGHQYSTDVELRVKDLSYTFPFYPNVWNSWFVPFEITTDELDAEGFTAAYIAGVRQYEKDAEGNITTQVDIIKITNGKLRAGTPYLIKQKSDATETSPVTFNKSDATLKTSSDVNNIHTETATAKYDFIGTYNEIANKDAKADYILGSNGAFVHPSSPVYPMNWYMKVTPKGDVFDDLSTSSQSKAFIINVIGEEDEITGIRTLYTAEKQVKEVYDLSGRRINSPKKGQINIINGKKILVK